jgi:imidazolonepropionase-like amidohydrolase/ABC-type multidrug transport system permease subunit
MKPYLALIRVDLKLAFRNKGVIFFNYLFPLLFFFIFSEMMKAERSGTISYVVSMVLVMGILGNGLFGAGVRAVQEREMNILRRFKVTPISPVPLLVASLVTGWVISLPIVVVILALAHGMYGMPVPQRLFSLFGLISLGVLAFRSLGLILAAVANSMQESQLLIQLLYMPMLFLSGATFPITMLPRWGQVFAQFLPASYLVTGFQGVFFRRETLLDNRSAALALLVTTVLGTFVSAKLFRWEKEEKISLMAKLWVLAVLCPFVLLGVYQAYSQGQLRRAVVLNRNLQRSENLFIREARIFVGDGQVIESGSVLIKNGKIEEVYPDPPPDPKSLQAEIVEAAGKTLLPGLIDVHVHLSAPGGFYESASNYTPEKTMRRALAAYLYGGITTVKSVGDPLEDSLKLRQRVSSGEILGAELFVCGPMFTTEDGHGTEYFEELPEAFKTIAQKQWLRLPKTPEEARRQVRELKRSGVDGIKVILEGGTAGKLFNRLDVGLLEAIVRESRLEKLPIVVHTGDSHDIRDALPLEITGIERGSFREPIMNDLLDQMAHQGTFYDPTLSVAEAHEQLLAAKTDLLSRSLVQQVGPLKLLQETQRVLRPERGSSVQERSNDFCISLFQGQQNLLRAYQAGVRLVTGSDAGNLLVIHGPTIQRELQLWVKAGIPPKVALQAATGNAAQLLQVHDRIGLIQKGHDADLLLVDGDPLQDIDAIERISLVIYKGERLNRPKLFEAE